MTSSRSQHEASSFCIVSMHGRQKRLQGTFWAPRRQLQHCLLPVLCEQMHAASRQRTTKRARRSGRAEPAPGPAPVCTHVAATWSSAQADTRGERARKQEVCGEGLRVKDGSGGSARAPAGGQTGRRPAAGPRATGSSARAAALARLLPQAAVSPGAEAHTLASEAARCGRCQPHHRCSPG